MPACLACCAVIAGWIFSGIETNTPTRTKWCTQLRSLSTNEIGRFRHLVTGFWDTSIEIYPTLTEIFRQYGHEDSRVEVRRDGLNDQVKYDGLGDEIMSGARIVNGKLGTVTYCVLKMSVLSLFGLNAKPYEFAVHLETALLDYYGRCPRLCMGLHPTSILCEVMGGWQMDG